MYTYIFRSLIDYTVLLLDTVTAGLAAILPSIYAGELLVLILILAGTTVEIKVN